MNDRKPRRYFNRNRDTTKLMSEDDPLTTRIRGGVKGRPLIRRLEGSLEPRSPVARPSPPVCDRENLDVAAADRVDETEGKTLEKVAARSTAAAGCCRVSSGVPVIRGFHFLRCGRMEPDSRCWHLALVQTRSKLFPGNRLDDAGV